MSSTQPVTHGSLIRYCLIRSYSASAIGDQPAEGGTRRTRRVFLRAPRINHSLRALRATFRFFVSELRGPSLRGWCGKKAGHEEGEGGAKITKVFFARVARKLPAFAPFGWPSSSSCPKQKKGGGYFAATGALACWKTSRSRVTVGMPWAVVRTRHFLGQFSTQ